MRFLSGFRPLNGAGGERGHEKRGRGQQQQPGDHAHGVRVCRQQHSRRGGAYCVSDPSRSPSEPFQTARTMHSGLSALCPE